MIHQNPIFNELNSSVVYKININKSTMYLYTNNEPSENYQKEILKNQSYLPSHRKEENI